MKDSISEVNTPVNPEAQVREVAENKARVLVVDGHPAVRHELAELISRESDIVTCFEVESADETLDAIKKRQVDLAVVDISLGGTSAIRFAERIKLESPTLPVLILSVQDESSRVEHALRAGSQSHVLNRQAGEQIIGAVHYIQSLLRSRVFGFTVFVKVERSATDG
ncbi:MAG: response regulator transcription factor [Planctomycetota bacterium]|nr:MAG: response regulator transcription factor [Planctomycetota bacterium]